MTAEPRAPQSTVIWGEARQSAALTCAHCGETFELPAWQPRLRCPHCQSAGYPDRSGRYLLTLDWECLNCGSTNDGRTNFCLNCGSGLASRCVRCEAPVYTAVCSNCGGHQGRLSRFQKVEADRAQWEPVIRQRLEQQRAREEMEAHRQFDPRYGVASWEPLLATSPGADAATTGQQRASRRAGKPAIWGWLVVLAGLVWLITANYQQLLPVIGRWLAVLRPGGPIAEQMLLVTDLALAWLDAWWQAFSASLTQPPGPDDPEYAYLFAAGIFGLAVLPIALFLLARLIRRLFP